MDSVNCTTHTTQRDTFYSFQKSGGIAHKSQVPSPRLVSYITAQSRQSAKFFSSRRNWDFPNPSTAGECAPPPPVLGGGAYSLAWEGVGRVPIPTRGHPGRGHTRWRERGWESPNSDERTPLGYIFVFTASVLFWVRITFRLDPFDGGINYLYCKYGVCTVCTRTYCKKWITSSTYSTPRYLASLYA